jgi:membrane fusion protein, copper/silver efflux system
MNKFRLAFLIVVIAALSFLAGGRFRQKSSPQDASSQGRRILYYIDPMHPAYKSDKPGVAPDCGMRLEPVYADSAPARPDPTGSSFLPTGSVRISPEKQQIIGVRVGKAEMTSGTHTLRLLGRVVADENRVYRLVAAVDGWIQETKPRTTGSLVSKDEHLASFYSPEFLGAEQAYLYALGALSRFQASGKETPEQLTLTQVNIKQYRDSLRNLGMGDFQLDEIARTRKLTQDIAIRSPTNGFVLARNVSPGQRFEKGTEFYKIADLRRVWVLADAFENEAQYFRPGSVAKVSLPRSEETLRGRVSDVLPQVDPATRTLEVRVEVDNPRYVLRPDMFVDVELSVAAPAGLSVPAEAVLDSGQRKTVFVDRGNGVFEPHQVETGWRTADRVQIVKGLMPGELVVTDGNFLIDSESRLKAGAGVHGATAQRSGVRHGDR